MVQLETSIEIHAGAARVWQILSDFAAYPGWSPFIRSIEGEQVVGGTLSVTIQPEGGSAMSFKPRVLRFTPDKELRWKGRVLMPGIFDGEHYLQLDELSPGSVRFTQGERFTGILVPLAFRGAMRAGTELGFHAMNRALKARAEEAQ